MKNKHSKGCLVVPKKTKSHADFLIRTTFGDDKITVDVI